MPTSKTQKPRVITTYDPKANTLTCENVGIQSTTDDPQRIVTIVYVNCDKLTEGAKWHAIGAQLNIQAAHPLRKAGDGYLSKNKKVRIDALQPGALIRTPEQLMAQIEALTALHDELVAAGK